MKMAEENKRFEKLKRDGYERLVDNAEGSSWIRFENDGGITLVAGGTHFLLFPVEVQGLKKLLNEKLG